jgi:hypothetical protein
MSATIVARGPSSVRMRFRPGLVGLKGDHGDQAQSTTDAQAAAALAAQYAAEAAAYGITAVYAVLNSLPSSTDGLEPAGLAIGDFYWNGDFLCRKSST